MLLLFGTLLLSDCTGETAPASTGSPELEIEVESKLAAAERASILDAAWQTVNDKYFDPTFGGKDWQAIGDAYRQKSVMVGDDRTFWLEVLRPMLFELGVSQIDKQSPGGVTSADVKVLPSSAILIYPVLQLSAPDGTVLEGRGVNPDIPVELDRELLLQGIDSQLQAAIEYLEGGIHGD
jgi:hypothetical protein